MERSMRKSYAIGGILLTIILTGCSIALIALVLQWHSFTGEDGNDIRFPVEGLDNLEVKKAASLLWSCVLVSFHKHISIYIFTYIYILYFQQHCQHGAVRDSYY